ncbi:hypothetical protein DFA_08171 [Cavenderia fasciculata]|uniref:Uncharacterized protein n=1 Tax=Cavenderia fasciculata TaxID=261658 RepID=F4Q5C6_CACFS|nr:uncharacterized protein DFA_08171 [Cavenderia fasciculata]EGG17185.1 hypothetical protein DFA_08171 [Cavenderia fasciculata]|eukprot:XP_004355669.1 hypothetical protein DFA_08171 [Cavenderia fasciculata]
MGLTLAITRNGPKEVVSIPTLRIVLKLVTILFLVRRKQAVGNVLTTLVANESGLHKKRGLMTYNVEQFYKCPLNMVKFDKSKTVNMIKFCYLMNTFTPFNALLQIHTLTTSKWPNLAAP